MNDFKKAIINNDIKLLKKVDKVDIHNHALTSCTKKYLIDHNIKLTNERINDIQSLIDFSRHNIKPLHQDENKLRTLLAGNFENCIETGVTIVAPSIAYKTCIRTFNSDVDRFIDFLRSFEYDNLKILWDLAIIRDSYKEEYRSLINKLIETKFFTGIDLTSTENSVPNLLFKKYYEIANSLNMITKVHTGEQLGPNYVYECIKDFNPQQIQHGIHIVENKKIMQIAKENGIIFNVCPTSNIVLGYAKSFKEHPIKEMVEYGLKVTIATDDLLFFDSDINNEYIKLYKEGTLTIDQLDDIRLFGLSMFEKEEDNKIKKRRL